MTDVPLPGMPEPIEIPEVRNTHVRRVHTGRLCAPCESDVIVLGVAKAPHPSPITYAVSRGSFTRRLCARHAREWLLEIQRTEESS